MNAAPSDEELGAFIDGELDAPRAAAIRAQIDVDPALAERVEAYRSDTDLIAATYGKLIDRPLPAAWLSRIERGGGSRRPILWQRRGFALGLAALAASLILLVGGGLAVRSFLPLSGEAQVDEPIIAEALATRDGSLTPQFAIDNELLSDPATRNEALSRSLAMTLKAPDLSRMGYVLAAMRVYDHVPGGRAVALSYRDAKNREFTLYLRRPSSAPRVDLTIRAGARICIWQDEFVGAVMIGQMSAGEMARISSLAYSGLNL